jgi:GIGANTEA protein
VILTNQLEVPTSEATIDATAQGIASLLCAHGPEVEWRICTIWEAAYGLLPLSSSAVDLPEIVVATPLQPPTLSWSLYLPLLKVLEYLPRGSPSEACLIRIFVATVEAILRRTFPIETSTEHAIKSKGSTWSTTKNLAAAELRTMIHSLFLESCASMDLASRLLFVVLTVSVSHETLPGGSKKTTGVDFNSSDESANGLTITNGTSLARSRNKKRHGPIATFDSYVLAAVCALSCELQLFPLISKNGNHSKSKASVKVTKNGKGKNGITAELQTSIGCAILHTRRILGILEALFSLKPSSVGTSWSYSSDEIVAAAMVAAHVSELFRRSKACMNALSSLMRCKWDPEIFTRASSLYHLIDLHGKTVSSIVNKVEPLEATLVLSPVKRDYPCTDSSLRSNNLLGKEVTTTSSESKGNYREALSQCNEAASTSGKSISSLPMEASDLANFLTMDRNGGYNCRSLAFLRSVLAEKQELCFSVVSLLWHKLIAAPETKMCAESTSAHQGWRKVVDAICDVVSASPTKASTAIVLQAEKDLQPWIARDDEQGQSMWRVNQRIVKLIVELMRNHDSPEALIILSSSCDLLLRATDGMLVDGEACTLPQLELLEVTARAVHLVVEWGEAGISVADGLSNLLKCRLSATIRCLSHPSAHVRALSMSLIRDIMQKGPVKTGKLLNGGSINGASSYKCLAINWHTDIERCIEWEARTRRATGLTLSFLDEAAKELGFFLG